MTKKSAKGNKKWRERRDGGDNLKRAWGSCKGGAGEIRSGSDKGRVMKRK